MTFGVEGQGCHLTILPSNTGPCVDQQQWWKFSPSVSYSLEPLLKVFGQCLFSWATSLLLSSLLCSVFTAFCLHLCLVGKSPICSLFLTHSRAASTAILDRQLLLSYTNGQELETSQAGKRYKGNNVYIWSHSRYQFLSVLPLCTVGLPKAFVPCIHTN